MRIWCPSSIPLFLESGRGKVAAQVHGFDVGYIETPIVGWHVVGATPETAAGFFVEHDPSPILFFTVVSDESSP